MPSTKSKLINEARLSPSEITFTALINYCFLEARQIAMKKLRLTKIRLEPPTAVANLGLQRAVKALCRAPAGTYDSSEKFTKLLTSIIGRIVVDQIRLEGAGKRPQTCDSEGIEPATSVTLNNPSSQAVAREVATKIASLALDKKDKIRSYVNTLGGLLNLDSQTIHSAIEDAGMKSPSPSTIRCWLQEFRDRVKKELGIDQEDE